MEATPYFCQPEELRIQPVPEKAESAQTVTSTQERILLNYLQIMDKQ